MRLSRWRSSRKNSRIQQGQLQTQLLKCTVGLNPPQVQPTRLSNTTIVWWTMGTRSTASMAFWARKQLKNKSTIKLHGPISMSFWVETIPRFSPTARHPVERPIQCSADSIIQRTSELSLVHCKQIHNLESISLSISKNHLMSTISLVQCSKFIDKNSRTYSPVKRRNSKLNQAQNKLMSRDWWRSASKIKRSLQK